MKGVRFTKAEVARIRQVCGAGPLSKEDESIIRKLSAAETAPSGVSVKPIEDALIKASRGKVLALEGGHAMASRRLTAMKVTVEEAELVGDWMGRQGWLTSAMTLLDVLNKWYQWLPKARATQPPPSFGPGLGANVQEEKPGGRAAAPSRPSAGRRPAPGLR